MNVLKAYSNLGEFGLFQLVVFLQCAVPCILAGMFILVNVFFMFESKHRCYVDQCEQVSPSSSWLNFAIPEKDGSASSCEMYKVDAVQLNNSATCSASLFKQDIVTCDRYSYENRIFNSTIISEWDLVCDKAWQVPLSQSFFMVGALLGAMIFGLLADKYGRKMAFYFAPLIAIAGCTACSYAPNLLFYNIIAVITNISTMGMYITAFILVSESVGPSARTWCGNIQQCMFNVGILILGVFAYFIRDWRQLGLSLIYPMLVYLILPFTLPESILWLNSRGKTKQAMEIVRKAARWNKIQLEEDTGHELNSMTQQEDKEIDKEVEETGPLAIFRNAKLRRWSLNLFFNWYVNALVYYSLSLQSGSLSSDPFHSYFLINLMEIPSVLLITPIMQYFGRRKVLCLFLALGGLACLAPLIVPDNYSYLITYLAMFGKGTISATFALIYVYSVEIYPTVIRSSGLGICSVMARSGSITAPFVNYLKVFGPFVPLYTCGLLSIAAGILSLDLPETNNKPLPQTMEDLENMDNSDSIRKDP
ncbi:Organic cation transporter-like protein [Halotydeus destructor]|nr:Organic cation transporter-like protein [Halotydeus destructor]